MRLRARKAYTHVLAYPGTDRATQEREKYAVQTHGQSEPMTANASSQTLYKIRKASETSLFRVLVSISAVAIASIVAMFARENSTLILIGCVASASVVAIAFRFDYLHPAVVFMTPWIVILGFSTIPISKYAHPLDPRITLFILSTISVWLLVTASAEINAGKRDANAIELGRRHEMRPIARIRSAVSGGFLLLYVLAGLNVAHAGYVPLVSLLTTGNSGYMTFGLPTFYGAYLAFANSMACLALYLYFTSRERMYLILFLSVLILHVLFITRQNIVTLLVEAFVIRSFTVRRVSRVALLSAFAVFLMFFALLGTLRSGNIKHTIDVRGQYTWVPTVIIWLYAYSYFNVLNLENMITRSGAPFYDGSMWRQLLPSVLRPDSVHASYLQLTSMNVTSYMYPIYFDVGDAGVKVWTFVLAAVTVFWYRRAIHRRFFSDVTIYACLLFCAAMSFFVGFWFYLPVIFQVTFFLIFQRTLFRPQMNGVHQ